MIYESIHRRPGYSNTPGHNYDASYQTLVIILYYLQCLLSNWHLHSIHLQLITVHHNLEQSITE